MQEICNNTSVCISVYFIYNSKKKLSPYNHCCSALYKVKLTLVPVITGNKLVNIKSVQ